MHETEPPLPRAQARRRQVTDAARKLFVAKGFHNTGMAEIATESGVKVGQIYRDFPCKEGLVAGIVEADFATLVDDESLRLAVARGDRRAVMAVIERLFEPTPCDEIMPEIIAEASRNPRIADIVNGLDRRFRAILSDALTVFAPGDGMRAHRDGVAEIILMLIVGMSHRLVVRPEAAPLTVSVRATIVRELDALASAAEAG